MRKSDNSKRHRSPDTAIPSKNRNGKKYTQSPKRARMSQSSTPANGMVASSRAQTGPRKITIKKLRSISNQSIPDNYINEVWVRLEETIHAIYEERPVPYSRNQLYREVENLCVNQMGPKLYEKIEPILRDVIRVSFEAHFDTESVTNKGFLKQLESCWNKNYEQLILITSIFGYLHCTIQASGKDSLWDLGLKIFKENLKSNDDSKTKFLERTITQLLQEIENERQGEAIDRTVLKNIIRMLIDLQLYSEDFESKFIFETTKLYQICSKTRIQDGSFSLPEYLDYISLILTQENDKILHYLDSTTRKLLNPCIRKQLIEDHIDAIINKGFDDLLRADRIRELLMMYDFLCSVKNGEDKLREAFENFIKTEGYELVRYPEKDKTMIKELLDFKKSIDLIISQAFKDNDKFIISMKKGFEKFINMRQNKPAEMIAKYLDAMLIAGHKGTSSDEELDTNMDKIMVIFRFIYGKDIFEGFYKQNLSKRLLHGKSASVDAEKAMLIKLKQECGPDFTSKLEEMFKDIELSVDLSHTFKEQSQKRLTLDMSVYVLSKANWPTYQCAKVIMPVELSNSLDNFQSYYKSNYSGRTLEWQHSLGHCKLKANFKVSSKELHVSFFQALVLLLFNSTNTITFQKISEITSIDIKQLKMTLIALTMGKVKVLQKSHKGTNIEDDTEFIYNENFNHHLHSIKINQVQMKESEEENDKTRTKVIYDRNMQMDAGIMRIMKTRKKLNHSNLLGELSDQTNFPIRVSNAPNFVRFDTYLAKIIVCSKEISRRESKI
eukprot:TRINITY_DN9108_c0_g1_i7.p1 TRINITY_DN9108_c0_g1~~TRINITY_DN9108_c0_g1_i7.p1  ORF type:complete len:781 (+),score=101.85 TRINITY_DN9108_c0_g1_i7:78-2420(+)